MGQLNFYDDAVNEVMCLIGGDLGSPRRPLSPRVPTRVILTETWVELPRFSQVGGSGGFDASIVRSASRATLNNQYAGMFSHMSAPSGAQAGLRVRASGERSGLAHARQGVTGRGTRRESRDGGGKPTSQHPDARVAAPRGAQQTPALVERKVRPCGSKHAGGWHRGSTPPGRRVAKRGLTTNV